MGSKNIFGVSLIVFLSILVVGLTGVPAGHCDTFTVTNLSDGFPAPAGSLRKAIEDANATDAHDTIVFAEGLTGTIVLDGLHLDVDRPVTIEGPGADVLGITTTDGTTRIIEAELPNSASLFTIRGLKLSRGGGEGNEGGAIAMKGGGSLVVDACELSNNTVKNDGGSAGGGAIFLNEGTGGRILNSVIKNNVGEGGGGAILAEEGTFLEIQDTEISGNTTESTTTPGQFDDGGGIYFMGSALTVYNSVISNNHSDDGGGILINAQNEISINIGNSQIINNTCTDAGGGLAIEGNEPSESLFNISNTEISGNSSGYDGGGLAMESVQGNINNSTIADNFAGTEGEPEAGNGGGMYIESEGGLVTVLNTTFSGNMANRAGGGIAAEEENNLSFINVTIFGNLADADGIQSDGEVMDDGGGLAIIDNEGSSVRMKSSILAGNFDATSAPDCFGALVSDGFNLLGNDEGCIFLESAGDLIGTAADPLDPLLDPELKDNGGPTPTHALLAGSPALDAAGGNAGCGVDFDQRGVLRPQGPRCDMGAYELEVAEPDDSGGGQEAESGDGCSCRLGSQAPMKHLAWGYLLCFGIFMALFAVRKRAKLNFRRRK
ncbi:MAG: right-handed parallel beta-helix repeat-containing protein [bacterium]|nr:right-handed parallel beta-helix repeat-containing protein [bacterium]